MLADKIVQVKKLADTDADADKEGYEVRISSVPANIQPASDETVILHDGNFGETFTMWTPVSASGISVGDRVTTISGTDLDVSYTVKGRKNWNMPPQPHFEFVLFKIK